MVPRRLIPEMTRIFPKLVTAHLRKTPDEDSISLNQLKTILEDTYDIASEDAGPTPPHQQQTALPSSP